MKKERLLGPDIVRSFAVLFVILIHSTQIFGVIGVFLTGIKGYISIFIRSFALICVPLFLILTGYFQCTKVFSKKFYKGIIPVLTSYIFISAVTLFCLPLDKRPTFFGGIKGILNFTANPYSWYVEMYIGLFLLIPFLNIMYNGLKSKKQKLILICTLIFITGISDFFLFFGKNEENLFTTFKYWENFYPVSYYFIGCFIREYKPKIKKGINFLLIIFLPCVISAYLFVMCYGESLKWWMFTGWSNIIIVVSAVLFFLFFYDLNLKNKFIKIAVSDISLRSFDMYLFSFIADDMVSRFFIEKGIEIHPKYIIIGVPLIFLFSYILAKIKQLLFFIIKYVGKKLSINKDKSEERIDKAS